MTQEPSNNKLQEKALLLLLNSKNELFIQDRRGHKKPDWGYFGGSIEEGETPLEAILREAKEELCLDLRESDLISLGELGTDYYGNTVNRYFYLYPTDQAEFDVREGKGGVWLSFNEARERMDHKDRFDEIIELIRKTGRIS